MPQYVGCLLSVTFELSWGVDSIEFNLCRLLARMNSAFDIDRLHITHKYKVSGKRLVSLPLLCPFVIHST